MRAVVLALFAILLTACAEPLVFSDWTIPVPEGTRIVEYAHVPMEDRSERIELERDLMIGGETGDPNRSFYQARWATVDREENIYVLDSGNHRIQVFDREGQYLRTMGSEGQGPGELSGPRGIAIAGDKVVVTDNETARFNFWSLDGEYLGAVPLPERSLDIRGLADGGMVGRHSVFRREPVSRVERAFVQISEEGELRRLALFPMPAEASIAIPTSSPDFASSPDGHVYVYRGDQYQVLALNAAGEPRWALRTTWPTPEISPEVFDRAIAAMRERQPDYDPPWDRWPDHMPAIGRIAVDGQGNVYVFPYVFVPRHPYTGEAMEEAPREYPVDVYSPEGEPLFSGWMQPVRWAAVFEDYVYTIGLDPESREEAIFRNRLVKPFE